MNQREHPVRQLLDVVAGTGQSIPPEEYDALRVEEHVDKDDIVRRLRAAARAIQLRRSEGDRKEAHHLAAEHGRTIAELMGDPAAEHVDVPTDPRELAALVPHS